MVHNDQFNDGCWLIMVNCVQVFSFLYSDHRWMVLWSSMPPRLRRFGRVKLYLLAVKPWFLGFSHQSLQTPKQMRKRTPKKNPPAPWRISWENHGLAPSKMMDLPRLEALGWKWWEREREREAETKGWGEKWCVVYNISLTTYIFTNG